MITVQKIGRNDRCLCGSGKKYKKCCYLTQAGVGTANDESLVSEQLAALESSVKNKTDKVKLIKSDIKMSAVITDFAEEIYNEAKTTTQRKKR